MSNKNCCCGVPPGLTFDTFCCNPILFTDFITLFGDNMAEHAEVSPGDWIALKQHRALPSLSQYNCAFKAASVVCNCCCECAQGINAPNPSESPTSKKKSLEANDLFDPNNQDGSIYKKGRIKPKNKNFVANNSLFFSGRRLNSSRKKIKNPSVENKNSVNYSYNKSISSQYAIEQYYNATNVNPGSNVELFFNSENLTGNYVLGKTIDINDSVKFDNKFLLDVTPVTNNPFSELNNTDNDFGFEEWDGWENDPPCPAKCNNTIGCCEGATDCPPTPCEECCCRHKEVIQTRPYQPMYFAYKYSGCHFTWYPREMLFGKDPYVPQCTHNETFSPASWCRGGGSAEGAIKKATTTCGVMSSSRLWQGSFSSRDVAIPDDCSNAGTLYKRVLEIDPGTINRVACHCASIPHIHGGMADSLTNTPNVSQRVGQLGYVSSFKPFIPPMLASELDCCWCSSVNPPAFPGFPTPVMEWMNTKASCASVWPTGNGTGKRPVLGDPCAPGFACYYMHYQNNNYLVGNPNYTTACFRYGISPYLLRISKTLYKAAYGVYSYGGGLNKVFGANLICTRITPNELTRDYEVSFAEIPNSPTTLRDQCIGFVQLEHHFECCAFRSDVGIKTRDPGLLINSCNANVPLFEAEGYPGSFTNSPGAACPAINPGFTTIRAKWTPSNYGANLWQIKRGIPRRVMYAGSGIPIFKFDLLNMENIVNSNPGAYQETFKATTFLEHYYRYYFGLTTYYGKGCAGGVPEPPEWNFGHYKNSYQYVTYWLEKMVEVGVLRIKDHAIDIANDVNKVIGSAINVDGAVIISPEVSRECGGPDEFLKLCNFFGVEPGTTSVTPKQVKQLLLNPQGLSTYDGPGSAEGSNSSSMRAFLPRRARLPIAALESKIQAWGCNGNSPETQISGCTTCNGQPVAGVSCCIPEIVCPSYVNESVNVPPIVNATTGPYRDIKPARVISGLAATFFIDRTGKLSAWGGYPQSAINDYTRCALTPRTDFPNSTATYQISCSYDMHPPTIVNIPWYLDLAFAFDNNGSITGVAGELLSEADIPDGKVVDLVFNLDYAVAMLDFIKEGLGAFCESNFGDQWKLAWEWGEWDANYQLNNTNGSNNTLWYEGRTDTIYSSCIVNEPWGTSVSSIGSDTPDDDPISNIGARSLFSTSSRNKAYRLKSWGSRGISYGTFSLCREDAAVFNYGNKGFGPGLSNCENCNGNDPIKCGCSDYTPTTNTRTSNFWCGNRGYDARINPDNLRYPGTNTWFIWNKIAGGLKHFAALDDFGGLFITALSSNEDNQSAKGKPLPFFDINRPESWPQQGFSDPTYYRPDYNGFESRFNYFNHIPRPGFISEENWSQDLYNSLTSRYSPWLICNGACQVSVNPQTSPPQENPSSPCIIYSFRTNDVNMVTPPFMDKCYNNTSVGSVGGNNNPSPCVQPIKVFDPNPSGGTCAFPGPLHSVYTNRVFDLTTYFMGSYCQRFDGAIDTDPGNNSPYETINGCTPPEYPIGQQRFNEFQPRYIDLSAGTYNTMLLTNENRIEIYGSYYQIDESGNKIGPKIKIQNPTTGEIEEIVRGITCFVPNSVLQKQGSWGITYGCPTYCRGITFDSNGVQFVQSRGVTHYPILSASYSAPAQNNQFSIIKSGCDYSIAITKGSEICIWGDASMVPGQYNVETYYPGKTADTILSIKDIDIEYAPILNTIPNDKIKIKEVAIGVNSFYIHYEITINNVGMPLFRTCSYTRYKADDFNSNVPAEIQNKKLLSISAGNGFAVAITSAGEGPISWDASSFGENIKYQYSNFSQLPLFLRRDAFFHAIPGNWDYSKWIWGDTCCFAIHDVVNHPVLEQDTCSALAYSPYRDKNGNPLPNDIPADDPRRFNPVKSYSGHPEYLWMRPDLRRVSSQLVGRPTDFSADANCSADDGIDGARPLYDTGQVGGLQSVFSMCFNRGGPGWQSMIPVSPLKKIRTKKPSRYRSCVVDPCDGLTSKSTGICSDKWGAYICTGVGVNFQTSQSANKDLFQQKTIMYGSDILGSDFCYQAVDYVVDYFKYSQRNFYLGYDSEKDTWEIYNSPDIFRSTLVNTPINTDLCCDENANPDGCPSDRPEDWLCPGATATNQSTNCGWGGGVTCNQNICPNGCSGCTCGWPSLSSYPMVGPNYTRLDYGSLPIHYPNDQTILIQLLYTDFGIGINSSGGNSTCNNTDNPCLRVLSRRIALERFAGPGGLAFNFDPARCDDSGTEINETYYAYRSLIGPITDSPYVMLKGIESTIDRVIPPSEDLNYKSVGFDEVLRNPNHTNINIGDFFDKPEIIQNYRFKPGFPGKVLKNNHGLTVGNIIIFNTNKDLGATGEGGIISEVRIKNPVIFAADANNPKNFLQLEKEYFVGRGGFTENEFSIAETPDDAYNGRELDFYMSNNVSNLGYTGSSQEINTKWYPLFDIVPSKYNGIAGIEYGDTPCWSGGPVSCYEGPNPAISADTVVLLYGSYAPEEPANVVAIWGIPYLCDLQPCCE